MLRVRSVRALEGFRLVLVLTDGTEKTVDVARYLVGPIFEPLKSDRSLFEGVTVDPELGAIVWPNGADIDPDVLIRGLRPAAHEAPARSAS